MKPALYLIPVTLGDTEPSEVLPKQVFRTIMNLDEFIVENVRSARRFLRKAGYQKDFNEVTFYEIGKHHKEEDLIMMLHLKDRQKSLGLLSEAGVPCVADPGSTVVELCHQMDITVIPLVGPSSILLALMASGFNGQSFSFHGYLPIGKKELKSRIKQLELAVLQKNQTQLFIETPYRNNQMLEAIVSNCSDHLKLCIAGNLTTDEAFITTRPVSWWKQHKPDLNKKPVVFLLYK